MITYEDKGEQLKGIALPKWPAMVVIGERVTKKQAAEILVKTDFHAPDFHYAGNDDQHALELNNIFGIPSFKLENDQYQQLTDLRKEMEKLDLYYLANDQIVTSYIGGPHGWCDWNGNIFCNTFNIGKWPGVGGVADEWEKIAQAFPFLTLRCQLFNEETCGNNLEPVVDYAVENGDVVVSASIGGILTPPICDTISNIMNLQNPFGERGITIEHLKKKLVEVYGTIPQLGVDSNPKS